MTADTDTSGAITPENLAKVIANLDEYIAERASRMAEAALARTKTEADQRVNAIREQWAAESRQQKAVIEEMRCRLKACERSHKQVEAQPRPDQSTDETSQEA